jgi:Methyltransferase domain/2OG-Fe(II) oxygenase superfamily
MSNDVILASDPILGSFQRIRLPGDQDEQSFVAAMAVPTFAAVNGRAVPAAAVKPGDMATRPRGLEGVLHQGPAFCLDHIIPENICREWIQTFEALSFGRYAAGKNNHGALQVVVSLDTADSLGKRLSRSVDLQQVMERMVETKEFDPQAEDVRLVYAGLNRRWRIYRYAPGGEETFAPHIDAGFPPSGLTADNKELVWDVSDGTVVSRLTVLFYLNDDFEGGETNFYRPVKDQRDPKTQQCLIASVRPQTGSCLVFPQGVGEEAVKYARQHWPLHEGSPVVAGSAKYVIRSDILFAKEQVMLPLHDHMACYDHFVRDAFQQTSPILDRTFLHHTSSLYNPHMGVENAGPFLYSFLRMTKKKKIVEIGAGYTSLWILQALRDNEVEMQRVKELSDAGKHKLMDYPWSVLPPDSHTETSSLLCVDNCAHQKQTATGAQSIAQSLGLDAYFEFRRCDAFDLDFDNESIDVLWCDFGVGARMKDFAASAWPSLRPGGFLLCHSTITNLHTRDWLEAIRGRQSCDITGIPPDEYVEVSLLEPHKHYQNSISILQKRKGYSEPIYSQYA